AGGQARRRGRAGPGRTAGARFRGRGHLGHRSDHGPVCAFEPHGTPDGDAAERRVLPDGPGATRDLLATPESGLTPDSGYARRSHHVSHVVAYRKAGHDAALIRMLVDTGLRREELLSIHPDALDLSGQSVGVIGKGNRPRLAFSSAPRRLATWTASCA